MVKKKTEKIGKEDRKRRDAHLKIRSLMKERGIRTYGMMAGMLNMSPAGFYGIINGNFAPTPERIAALGHILGVTADELSDTLQVEKEERRAEARKIYSETAGFSEARKSVQEIYGLLCSRISTVYYQSSRERQGEIVSYLSRVLSACTEVTQFGSSELLDDLVRVLQGTFKSSKLEEIIASRAKPLKSELLTALGVLQKALSEEACNKLLGESYDQAKKKLDETYQRLDVANKINLVEKLDGLARWYKPSSEEVK